MDRSHYQQLAQIEALREICVLFYLNNFVSEKVKPCNRATRSPQGCTVRHQKGRQTKLDFGGWGGRFSVGKNCNEAQNQLLFGTSPGRTHCSNRVSPSRVNQAHCIIYTGQYIQFCSQGCGQY
jgi:hypothetical protein